ncbi:MAG: CheR family methyltransferase [Candidatus Latescibacterota bacterium]
MSARKRAPSGPRRSAPRPSGPVVPGGQAPAPGPAAGAAAPAPSPPPATDLDAQAVETARAGVYPEGISADVSPARLARYFAPAEGAFRVRPEIREGLVFAVHDLLKDPPFTQLDLIVCRNVLIYLGTEAQQRLLPLLHYALRPGGLLFLGSAEGLGGIEARFATVDSRWRIYRRLESAVAGAPVLPVRPREGLGGLAPGTAAPAPEPGGLAPQVQRLLLARFAPACVLVDGQGNVVYVQGRTGLYLEPAQGRSRHSLVDMAREGLGAALATALRQAQATNQEVRRPGVRVRTNDAFTRVDVAVAPVDQPEALRGLFLVTFAPALERPEPRPEEPGAPAAAPPTGEEELRRELQHTRESLQSTVEALETANEELRSSNEELQSTHEELQSSNEELETSKEEMESLNEELATVNAELRTKAEALALSHDDLQNLLNSIQVACVFLDEQLQVKRYTEKARDLIPLIDSDVGRPLADLATNLDYDGLLADGRRVLETLMPQVTEVRDRDGHWHLLRVLPYRTARNVIAGVVITLVNIDRAKTAEQTEAVAAAARDLFASIVQTVRAPLQVLDTDLQVVQANAACHRAFGTRPDQVVGGLLYALGEGRWDLPPLRERLGRLLTDDTPFEDLEVKQASASSGPRRFLLNARRLEQAPGLPALILLAMEEACEGRT